MHNLAGMLATGAIVLAAMGCGSGDQGDNTGGGGTGGSASHGGAGSTSSSTTTTSGSTTTSSSGSTLDPTFANVFDKVFTPGGCTNGACHYGVGINLSSKENAIMALIGTTASQAECGDMARVAPGDPEHSLLYLKVAMDAPPCGNRMPLNADPLDASQVDLIRAWIEAGAPE